MLSLFFEDLLPGVLCLTEHYLKIEETQLLLYRNISLGAGQYLAQENMNEECKYTVVDLSKFCVEKDLELVAIHLIYFNIVVVSLYRSPTGDFQNFISLLEQCLIYFW